MAVLLVGPVGSCKTAAVYACAQMYVKNSALFFSLSLSPHMLIGYLNTRSHSYHVLEVNASAARTGRHVLQLVSEATQSHQLTATSLGIGDVSAPVSNVDSSTLVLFEEIDVRSVDDHGLFSALQSLMTTTKRPIILTCNGE